MSAANRYLVVLLATAGVVLGAVLALNLALGTRGFGSPEITQAASEWQEKTKGVTYAPPVVSMRRFKILRLQDKLPGINAMMFGSSTVMGVTEAMFPAPLRTYNFTLTANPTNTLIAEAEFVLDHHGDRVKWMMLSLDWMIGMIYRSAPVEPVELTPEAALRAGAVAPAPLASRFADALALPKVSSLIKALRGIAGSPDPVAGFRGLFFDLGGPEYPCAEGGVARDFDVVNRGLCAGFRYDGSWTFGGEQRLSPARADTLARAAAAPSSKFSKFLCETGGEPNSAYLDRLTTLSRRLNGELLLYIPPLIPGMEDEMVKVPASKTCLARTRGVLDAWARKAGVTILDGGRSEAYGCVPGDFLDEHHAFPECHAKVFARYWSDRQAGRVKPGLYSPR